MTCQRSQRQAEGRSRSVACSVTLVHGNGALPMKIAAPMAWQVSWALWATVFRLSRAVTGGTAEPGEVGGPLPGPCPHPFCLGFPPHPTPRLRWLQGLSPHTPPYRGGDTGWLGAGPGGTWQALPPPAACPAPGSGREEVTAGWGAGCLDQGHTDAPLALGDATLRAYLSGKPEA